MKIKQLLPILLIALAACTTPAIPDNSTTAPSLPPPSATASRPSTNTPAPSPTLSSTFTTAATAAILPTPSKTPTKPPIHPLGKVVDHEAEGEILLNWFSYIPKSLQKNHKVYIWVTSATTKPNDSYAAITEIVKAYAKNWSEDARRHQYVLLTLALPRPKTNHLYVIAFHPKVFLPYIQPEYQRPDLQLNKMIDRLIEMLRHDGYDVASKVFIDGYSAGGMFAQRYALLNPERVMAVAGGQCGGSLTVPDPAYDWPVGIRDFEKLTGVPFNTEEYRRLPQLFYIGDLDTNNSTAHLGNTDVYTSAQVMTLFSLYGRQDPERLQNQVKSMQELGFNNVFFHMYPGVKHELSSTMISDTFTFFDKYR